MNAKWRAATLIALSDQGEHDLTFIQRGRSDTAVVHVAAHPSDWPTDEVTASWSPNAQAMYQLAMGRVYTVCGVWFARHRGGLEQGDKVRHVFTDERLCRRCYTAFAGRAVIIFEVLNEREREIADRQHLLDQIDADRADAARKARP